MPQSSKRQVVNPSWFDDMYSPETIAADSLYDLRTGIILPDIVAVKPNPRSSRYLTPAITAIPREGLRCKQFTSSLKEIRFVSIGNSVNVFARTNRLPTSLVCSRWATTVGDVVKLTNILESHIIGDPTFHFALDSDIDLPDLHKHRRRVLAPVGSTTKHRANIQGTCTSQYSSISVRGIVGKYPA